MPSTLTVTNNLDGPAGSLRAEIAAAQSGDTIVFANSLKGQTITVRGPLAIDKNLAIEGLGAKNLAISAGNQSQVFVVGDSAPNVQVTLSGMTIENGATVGNVAWAQYFGAGGGILNFGTLTVSSCTVSGNSAQFIGGGIANYGTMTVTGSTVSHNSVLLGAGYPNGGGGIYNDGPMALSGSTVTQNTGGGIFNDYSGVLTILSSTVKSNHYGADLVNHGTWSADSSSTIGGVYP